MDGASKFVRGDAIAGLIITVVNILGGLTIGVFQRGSPSGSTPDLQLVDGAATASSPRFRRCCYLPRLESSSPEPRGVEPGTRYRNVAFLNCRPLFIGAGLLRFGVVQASPQCPSSSSARYRRSQVSWSTGRAKRRRANPPARCLRQPPRRLPVPRKRAAPRAVDPMEVEIGYALIRSSTPPAGGTCSIV